jgi:acyl-CoA reductase-like NAD-dependent aldehyde dehydrogenase
VLITSKNPAQGFAALGQAKTSSSAEIQAAVARARRAQGPWAALPLAERIAALRPLIALMEGEGEVLARAVSREMGQTIRLSRAQVDLALENFAWKLDNAPAILAPRETCPGTVVHRIPIGTGAAIFSWNFPLPNLRTALQAVIAGNTVVVKYSEEVPLFSALLDDLVARAGVPEGVMGFVTGGADVGQALLEQEIDFVSFTGSADTGRAVYARAAEKCIPAVLELGGSSPGLVFPDANLDAALPQLLEQRFSNAGQFCSALKRLLVHTDSFEEVLGRLTTAARAMTLGDPLKEDTDMGPLVAARQLDLLEEQVADALERGAVAVCGAMRPEGLHGAFFAPTILKGVTRDMRVWREEVFGPVLPVVPFETYAEAIEMANDTLYGLTALVYTGDAALAARAARDIRAGVVSVNGASFRDPANPFGGVKGSGLGRENGVEGFYDVTQAKLIAGSGA